MVLEGVSFPEPADFQTWTFAAAGMSLILIAVYSLGSVAENRIEERIAESLVERVVRVPAQERPLEEPVPISDRAQERPATDFDLARIAAAPDRKSAFFQVLAPFVEAANRSVLEDRAQIQRLQQVFERDGRLWGDQLQALNDQLAAYRLDPVGQPTAETFRRLLKRADAIPASLALAQAALESGWGASRFARQGNNLFGMWCYEPGCGIVPKRRPAGRTYEVAAYRDPAESFEAYVRNLNTNPSYADLREIRYQHRINGADPSGYDLAAGLVRYSQERWAYVDKVRNLILQNRLERI